MPSFGLCKNFLPFLSCHHNAVEVSLLSFLVVGEHEKYCANGWFTIISLNITVANDALLLPSSVSESHPLKQVPLLLLAI